jgi:hypothetical protein
MAIVVAMVGKSPETTPHHRLSATTTPARHKVVPRKRDIRVIKVVSVLT